MGWILKVHWVYKLENIFSVENSKSGTQASAKAHFNRAVAESLVFIYKYSLKSRIQKTLASFTETATAMLSLKLSYVKWKYPIIFPLFLS